MNHIKKLLFIFLFIFILTGCTTKVSRKDKRNFNQTLSNLTEFEYKYEESNYDKSIYAIYIPLVKYCMADKEYNTSTHFGGKCYITCYLDSNDLINYLCTTNYNINVEKDKTIKAGLLISTDYGKIYPDFTLSINNEPFFEFKEELE